MEERLLRRQDETDEQYQIRLTLMKQNGVDIDWSEIAELVGDGRSSESFRKDSYGIRRYHNSIDKTDDNETLLEIKKERVKLSDLRSDVNKKIRQYARLESIVEEIKEECSNVEGFMLNDINGVSIIENGSDSILLLSDLHYDGRQEIIDDFNRVIDYTINKCKFHKINRLVVFLGGDLINNEFRTTTRIENREGISKQIVGVSSLISDGLYKLAKNIPYICVGNVVGNHSRSIADYKDSMTTDNYLCLIKELINLRLNDVHNITFLDNVKQDDRFCVVNIKGKTYVLCHGDGLRNIEKSAIPTIEGFLGIKINYLCLGHFHNIKDYTYFDSRVIVNGALCNEFDYSKKALLNTPCYQRLMMLDNSGDIECIYDIKL